MALRNNGNKIAVNETISNVSVRIIQITEDKLMNILDRHVSKIKKTNDWVTSLALFISLVGIAVTSDFHETIGVNADTLRGFFYFGVLFSFFYLVRTIYNCYKNRDSVDDIMKDIRNE